MNNESDTDFFDSITRFGMGTGIIGFVVFAMSYIFVTCLNHAAENQVTYNVIKYLTLAFQKYLTIKWENYLFLHYFRLTRYAKFFLLQYLGKISGGTILIKHLISLLKWPSKTIEIK